MKNDRVHYAWATALFALPPSSAPRSWKKWYDSQSWRQKRRYRWFHRVNRWDDRVTDNQWPERLYAPDWVQKALCLVFGHHPERDQCGIPAHDFCAYCGKPMPNQAGGARE